MRRRSFFSPTSQGDQPRVRITEQTLHSGSGTKAGEGVCIDQTTRFASSWHSAIMPNFGPTARALGSSEYRGLRVMEPSFLPTPNHEDPLYQTCPVRRTATRSNCGLFRRRALYVAPLSVTGREHGLSTRETGLACCLGLINSTRCLHRAIAATCGSYVRYRAPRGSAMLKKAEVRR